MTLDFLLKGGTVVCGASPYEVPLRTDIGIRGDRIEAIGELRENTAERIIDASGLCISPGFIDAHSHSEFTLLADGMAEGKICQGVTTEINGNCGFSAAPMYGDILEQRMSELDRFHINERWNSFSEYFEILRIRGIALNFLTLVGHGNLRGSVAGYADRDLTGKEKNRIHKLLGESLGDGARGLSTGLVYPPGMYADTSEIIDLARETVRCGGIVYTTHMRSEGNELLESLDEAVRIGFGSKIPLHISHLKTFEEKNWDKIGDVLKRIRDAQEKGLMITCDRYPYTAASTSLDVILPYWVYEGGRREAMKRIRLKEKEIREEILKIHPPEFYEKKVKIARVGSDRNKWMEGKSLYELSMTAGKKPLHCLFDILAEEELDVDAIFFSMSEDNLKTILQCPFTVIGTDSSARCFSGDTSNGKPHPRGFGSFPKVLGKYVREEAVLTLEDAIFKMTGLPAKIFRIEKRGMIKEGYYADITVFDPGKIIDRAGFDNPFRRPEGIYHVFVNGIPVMLDGEKTNRLPGKILD
jgi:N-acyl-D-amino-acid deacylase